MDEPWIISRPDLLSGKPCVRGTRISVDFILELLAGGATREQILAAYPSLTEEGLAAALRFAAERVRDEIVVGGPATHR
jgi:uncharacterized protein (DUF433 family)